MPRVCLVCGRELNLRERFLCLPCSMDLPLTRYETWEHNPMADKYNLRINQSLSGSSDPTVSHLSVSPFSVSHDTVTVTSDLVAVTSDPIEGLPEPYQRATALFFYRRGSGYDQITQALKYGRNFKAGRHFAAMLGRLLRDSPLFSDVDLVVPVPLHWTRRLRRGYNQAEVIAREIARSLSASRAARPGDPAGQCGAADTPASTSPARVAFAPRLLRRVRHTRTQTRVSSGSDSSSDSSLEARARNVAGAFAVQRVYTLTYFAEGMFKKGPKTHIPSTVSPRVCTEDKQKGISPQEIHHILLVDDVCTTASTLASCHSALRTVFGPEVRISVATLAFAE